MNKQKQMVMNVVSKPMLKHKWASKKRCFRESLITYKMKMRQGRGSRRESITHIKEAASHQIEAVTDATLTLGKGLKKSLTTYRKEAGRLAKSLGDFVDVEDILKSIHQVAHPEEHAKRKTSIVHTPIDWKKRTAQASEKCPTIFENEEEEGINEHVDVAGNNETNAKEESVAGFSGPRGRERNHCQNTQPIIFISSVQENFDEQEVGMSHRRPSTTKLGLAQNALERQNIKSSSRLVSTRCISFPQRDLEEPKYVLNNRRQSTNSIRLAQQNSMTQKTLPGRRLSSSHIGLQQNSFKDEKMVESRRLSTSILNQEGRTHTPGIRNSPTRVRRSSAPHNFHIPEDDRFFSSKSSQNSSQTDQTSSVYNGQSNLFIESHLPVCSRRLSCHSNPGVEMIDSSTKGRRRNSCFLNVKSGNANTAFRCKSPIMGKRSSYAGLNIC